MKRAATVGTDRRTSKVKAAERHPSHPPDVVAIPWALSHAMYGITPSWGWPA
jgi:hypothetical protein